MDFLLIVLAIGGLVFAVVMLVLASRAARMQRESDARVERLQTLATGSVLFASDALGGSPDLLAESCEPLIELGNPFFELPDETEVPEAPNPAPSAIFDRVASAYPFVMTVPAGAGRVPGSFDRTQRRS